MIVCPNCGRENADNFNFCLDCGYDLKSYRESMGADQGGAAPPVGERAHTPEPLGSGAPTESMSTEDVQNATSSPNNPVAADVTAAAMPAVEPAAVEPAAAPVAQAAQASVDTTAPQTTTPIQTCPSCHMENPAGNRFCGSCGSPMDGSPRTAQPVATAGGSTMFMHAADISNIQRERTCKLVTIDQTGQEGMTYSLKAGETLCGRVNGIILFFDDPYVSPTHCKFEFTGDKLKVADSGSLNGIYVRIQDEHALAEGDYLRIGRQLFRYESLSAAHEQVARTDGDDAKIWGSPNPGAFGRLLQILEDGRTGEIRLLAGEACNLGREQGEIVFPTDGFISGRHCSFFNAGGGARVKDLGSSNGTYLRVREGAELGHGDFMLVGNQMLRIEIV